MTGLVGMKTFHLLIGCILLFSLLTFTVLFGHIPVLRRSPIGWTNYFLRAWLPQRLSDLDQLVCGGKTTLFIKRLHQRVVHERHPSVLIMYLSLFAGGVYVFLSRLYLTLGTRHQAITLILIFLPLAFLYLTASTDPGYITRQTHAHYMAKYEFDGVLFRRGHECTTCLHEKPARSKHCPLCNKCIAKHDHHCIWINGCIGERNMKWFLAFLLSNCITFTYAAVMLYTRLSSIKQLQATRPSRDNDDGGAYTSIEMNHESHGAQSWLRALQEDVLLGSLFLFLVLCDAMVTAFLLYHSYLIFSGVTTNETLKFEDVREAIKAREVDIYRAGQGRFRLDLAGHADPVDWNGLENIYDKGWKSNMLAVMTD